MKKRSGDRPYENGFCGDLKFALARKRAEGTPGPCVTRGGRNNTRYEKKRANEQERGSRHKVGNAKRGNYSRNPVGG